MSPLVSIMLYGWIPLTVILFITVRPTTAVLVSTFGAFLFLPQATIDLPGIPGLTKTTAVAFGLLLGGLLSGHRRKAGFRWQIYDLPMTLWCFLSPVLSSVLNGLGMYDGVATAVSNYLSWGVFYWAGRMYFSEPKAVRSLAIAMVVSGVLYMPLCLYEIRMSPQLSNQVYDFFAHSFAQHYRSGGYRPIVFMQHGLMVALFMAQTFIVTYWLRRNNSLMHLKGLPTGLLALMLLITVVLCKSVNGMFFLTLGIASCFYFKTFKSTKLFKWGILLLPLYIILRLTNSISTETIEENVALLVNPDRVQSLSVRLEQEELFSDKAKQKFYTGWGGWERSWPVDPDTGERLVRMVDALWIIILGANGLVGLCSLYLAMLLGPWLVCKHYKYIKDPSTNGRPPPHLEAVVLSIVVIFFMIDSLMNCMVSPVYILCAGALVSYSQHLKPQIQKNKALAKT